MNRIDTPEIIDNPDTPPEIIRATLRDQALVNRLLGGGAATYAHVIPLIQKSTSDPLRILDIGCGGGDISRRIIDHARRIAKPIAVTAMDLHPTTLATARELSKGYSEMTFVPGDALSIPFAADEFDIAIMSTLLHHLPPDKAAIALKEAARVSLGWGIVSDLVRSRLAYIGIIIFARLVGFHAVSAHDGAISVRKAYTPSELAALADRAGLTNWQIHRHPIYRMTLVFPAGSGANQ